MDSVALKKYGVTKFEYRVMKYKIKRKQKKGNKSFVKRFIIAFTLVILVLCFGLGSKFVSNNGLFFFQKESTYFENTSVEGYDISGLNESDAYEYIKPKLDEILSQQKILYTVNDNEYQFSFNDLNISNDLSDVLHQIMEYQQSGNIFKRNKRQREIEEKGASYYVNLTYDQQNIKEILQETASTLSVLPIEPKLIFDADANIDSNYFTWSEGENGYEVDLDSFYSKVILSLETENYSIGELDLNQVAPSNSSLDYQESYVKISEFSTDVLWSKDGRENKLHNMNLLAEKLNGSIIEVGDNWSLNDIAGERNEENGWVLAPAIWSGAMTEEYGGGICQVASTIYNAMLLAEIDIVERHAHSSPSSYVDTGMDATVDYGVKDLVVQNNLADKVYLVVKCDLEAKTVTAMVFGPKPDHDYQVVVRSTLSQSNIQPSEEAEYIAVDDGFAPDGTYISSGKTYLYIKPKTGSRYKTYIYYYEQDYDMDEDSPYCWVGYEKGDNYSGEKREVMFVDSDTGEDIKNIMTYYPPQSGRYYYNPN